VGGIGGVGFVGACVSGTVCLLWMFWVAKRILGVHDTLPLGSLGCILGGKGAVGVQEREPKNPPMQRIWWVWYGGLRLVGLGCWGCVCGVGCVRIRVELHTVFTIWHVLEKAPFESRWHRF